MQTILELLGTLCTEHDVKRRASASPGVRNQYNEKGREMKEQDYSNVENISQIFPSRNCIGKRLCMIYELNPCLVYVLYLYIKYI